MIGALIGDIIGSQYEFKGVAENSYARDLYDIKNCRFTDDSVLTIAMADSILNGIDYAINLKKYYRLYSNVGYGPSFAMWAQSEYMMPYNSFGNGAVMRTSPVGWAFNTEDEILQYATKFSEVTHNHPSAINAARCISYCIFKLRNGMSKDELKTVIVDKFKYDFNLDIEKVSKLYSFGISCNTIMPKVLYSFFNTNSYEDAIKLSMGIDRDTDTIACIVGSLCEAYYGQTAPMHHETIIRSMFDEHLFSVIREFVNKYMPHLKYKI